jgi:hypothetical protein
LRLRTKVTAWVVVTWGILGLVSMPSSPAGSYGDRVFLIACGLVADALWVGVLMKRWWARNTLLVVLVMQFAGAIHNAAGLPHLRHPVDFWVGFSLLSTAIYAWQTFVLLTENRGNWSIVCQSK